jgi:hypothetical protein
METEYMLNSTIAKGAILETYIDLTPGTAICRISRKGNLEE